MADIARAMQTPPPGTPAPVPVPLATVPTAKPSPTAVREAKNERDRLRRAAKRAADAKAAEAAEKKAAAKPKKKKAATVAIGAKRSRPAKKKAAAVVAAPKKKRGRGRPPGAKNKPKDDIMASLSAAQPAAMPMVTSAITPLSIVVAMARMAPADRTATLAAIRAAFFDA